MNTNQEYEEYFSAVVQALEIKVPDPLKYVQRAISAGLKQFWGALDWSFRGGITTLSVTSAKDYYDLPDDFDGVLTVREETSNRGFKLAYLEKQQFDELIPKQSSYSGNNSTHYTIFYAENKQKVISIYPRPSSTTLYIAYYKTTPDDVTRIPDKFQSGLESCISAHVFLPGFNQRKVAYDEAMREIKRLEIQDKHDMSKYLEYLTEGQKLQIGYLPWWAY